MWAGCALRTFSLTAMLLVAGSPALAFKKQFKDVQCIHSNVGHAATITHVMLTDTATIVSFHKHDTTDQIHFTPETHLLDDEGRKYRIVRSEGIPHGGGFQKTAEETNDFKLVFEPLPEKTRFFDLIEGMLSAHFRILGIHDAGKPIRLPKLEDTVDVKTDDFIRMDIAHVRGRIDGYTPNMGFKAMGISLRNELTKDEISKAVVIQEDGTFETQLPLAYPTRLYFSIELPNVFIPIHFYAVPGRTTVVNVRKDLTVDLAASDAEILQCERLLKCGDDYLKNYDRRMYEEDRDSLSFGEMQEKLMGMSKANERVVDYVAWRNGFNSWEYHLARVWNKMYYAQWILECIMDARYAAHTKVAEEDSILVSRKMEEISDMANWTFFRELPYNDPTSLTYGINTAVVLNRYEYAPVLLNGQTHVTLENDNRQQLANDMLITGEDSPSLWGLLSVLRKMKLDIQHFHGSKEELKKQIDILREMLVYPALQIHLDNLYARELERQE